MREIQPELEPRPASIEGTVLVISLNIQLIQDVSDFCVSKNMSLWIGNPNSPDVIAIPYNVCIVDRDWMDKKSWADWIEFLKEVKGEEHDYLIIVILRPPFSDLSLDEARKDFHDSHEPVHFMFGDDGSHVVKTITKWMDTGSIESLSHVL